MLEILRQNADGNVELEALPVDLGDVSDTDGLRLDQRDRISLQIQPKSQMRFSQNSLSQSLDNCVIFLFWLKI